MGVVDGREMRVFEDSLVVMMVVMAGGSINDIKKRI